MGKKVLLVDCDASTNGLTLLFLSEVLKARDSEGPHAGIFELGNAGALELNEQEIALTGSSTMPPAVHIDSNLDLVPATYLMRQTEGIEIEVFRSSLGWLLEVANEYDYIFLDAQAGADTHAEIAVGFADKVVIVSEYDPISAEGVERLKRLFAQQLEGRDTWTLFNKVLPEFAEMRSDFLEVVRLLPPVPWDADVIRAFTRRRLAVNPKDGNPHTFALLAVLEPLFLGSIDDRLAEWRQRQESFLREPIKERVRELLSEVEAVENAMVVEDLRLSQRSSLVRRIPSLRSSSLNKLVGLTTGLVIMTLLTYVIWTLSVTRSLPWIVFAVSLPIGVFAIWALTGGPSMELDSQGKAQRLAMERQRNMLIAEMDRYQQLLRMDTSKLAGLSSQEKRLMDLSVVPREGNLL